MKSYSTGKAGADGGGYLAVLNDSNNSTVAQLGNGGVFTGVGTDTNGYASILVTIYSDKASATDGLSIQFSHLPVASADWHESDVYTIAAGSYKTFTIQPVDRYFRLVYTNGTDTTTQFHITVRMHTVSPKSSSHRITDDLSTQDDAELVKAVLAAEKPNGTVTNIDATTGGNLKISVEEFDASIQNANTGNLAVTADINDDNLDAFSRLRVSLPTTLFDSSFRYNLNPYFFGTSTANGGAVTHTAARAAATLSLDGTASGSAILQSKQYMPYIPGKSQLVLLTGLVGAGVGNQKRVGYYDANDGIYFEQDTDDSLKFVRRTSVSGSPVNNEVEQAAWNIDTLDGNGASGITLDVTKVYIMVIDFQWLGMGRVRVGFDIDGLVIWAHEFLNANVLTTVYMKTGSLPVRWEMLGDNADTMDAVCSAVLSESGGREALSYQFAYTRAAITAGSGTATYAFSVRPALTFNSITNRIYITPEAFQLAVTGNSPVRLDVYYGGAVGGSPSWAAMNAASGLEVDTAGTPSGGLLVDTFTVPSGAQSKGAGFTNAAARYPLALDIAGTGFNYYTVYVTGLGGTSACYPGLVWKEYR